MWSGLLISVPLLLVVFIVVRKMDKKEERQNENRHRELLTQIRNNRSIVLGRRVNRAQRTKRKQSVRIIPVFMRKRQC